MNNSYSVMLKVIINSKNDPFPIRTDLEDFLKRYSGGKISEHLFDKSEHVQNPHAYPHQYKQLIFSFLNKLMG